VNLTLIPKEDHIPTEQVEATKLERVIVYSTLTSHPNNNISSLFFLNGHKPHDVTFTSEPKDSFAGNAALFSLQINYLSPQNDVINILIAQIFYLL
jgi:hypothetical protein